MEAPVRRRLGARADGVAGWICPATRLLYLNQPHNPTGTLLPRPVFEHVIGLARAHGLVVFSDEVYRELEHDPACLLPAVCDEYERAVSLGSISKSYGLPGLRTGWIATRDAGLREAVLTLKDYTTICASAPSEFLDRAGAASPPGPPRPQPRDRTAQPAAPGRLLRAAPRKLRVDPPDGKPDRLSPRHRVR